MAAAFPSSNNTFVPSHEASGGLIVGFSRNPKKFRLNNYVKIVPVKKSIGYYLRVTAEDAARVINANLSDLVWADGNEAPMGDDNLESFQYLPYGTLRYAAPFTIGNKAVDQADWPILQVHAGFAAQKAMTARTIKALTTLTTTGNWGTSTGTSTSLVGAALDASTTITLLIKKLFRMVSENILKETLGVIQREDLCVVMNPHTAGILSETPEIVDHLKNNQFGLAQVRQDVPSQNGQWGLPDTLYGIKVIVEDAVKVTSKKGATKSVSYCLGDGKIIFLGRPGALVGMEGIPEFSTCQLFVYEEMTVESKNDVDNRRTMGRVVDDLDVQLVAPASGYLVTAATS